MPTATTNRARAARRAAAPTSSTDRLTMTMDQAARVVGISRARLYELLAEGRGPRTIKIGASRLVRREALDAWLAELEREQAS